VEKEIPQESNNLYSIYQQNVHKFFNELRKSISQYRQSMTNLQLECIKSCGIILNPALPFNQKFANKSTVLALTPPLKMIPPAQQTKIEEKAKAANEYTIQKQIPSGVSFLFRKIKRETPSASILSTVSYNGVSE